MKYTKWVNPWRQKAVWKLSGARRHKCGSTNCLTSSEFPYVVMKNFNLGRHGSTTM